MRFFTFLSRFFFIACLFVPHALAESLYDADDPLYEFDSSNFTGTVVGSDTAWIVEFYSSWCGHCIKYAPTWKEFARDVQNWNQVVKVGVVNCADPKNTDLCRQYGIEGYPTIKVFWHHINSTDIGQVLKGPRDVDSVQKFVISFLESNWDSEVPSKWPLLEPLKSLDFKEIQESHPSSNLESILMFLEHNDSFTGRKVILDLSSQDRVTIRRASFSNQELLANLKSPVSNDSLPEVLKLKSTGVDEPFLSFLNKDETAVRNKVYRNITGKPRIEPLKEPYSTTTARPNEYENKGVYMTDLENALYYSLSQEVGVSQYIEGERISALKAYLTILKKYFPGRQPVMKYLSNLNSWISYRRQSITGEEFIDKMNELQEVNQYLPKLRDWIGCKGSSSQYRGYPCSLWTLFHTLTVQADKSHDGDDPLEVLSGIKDYIASFFTCEECRRNFFKMDADMSLNSSSSTSEVVLWLWEAHNKVNHRLAGDKTEDPRYKKVQFPPPELCDRCQMGKDSDGNVLWNKYKVLDFLHKFYGRDSLLDNRGKPVLSGSPMGISHSLPSISAALVLLSWHLLRFLKL